MCGIAGIMVLNNVEKTILQRIEDCARAIAHRGPDNLSTTQFADIALSHSRLSIIDTSAAANQPLHDTAKEYTIVFNGEIFNYAEIRNELTHKGVNFQTQGDTEVFLELFKKEGLKALERISGFFAAAIYHHSTQKLYLFRDRYGVKPLYYYYNNHTFIFSSEVRGIRASGVSLTLCKEALHFYLQLNYIPGELSIYEEIKKIPAGHYAIICNDGIKCEPYYSLLSKLHSIHADENSIAQVLKNLLEKSVKDRLVADLPVGCFLSGGIDSTIVAGIAAREIPQLPTFSLGFKENSWFDESKYAELAARHFKTEHHTFSLTNHDLLEHFDDFLLAQDEPFADSSALNVRSEEHTSELQSH